MPDEINKKYEAKHLADIRKAQLAVDALYRKTIQKIFSQSYGIKSTGDVFGISDFPTFKKKVDTILLSFSKEVELTLVNGIKGQWELAINKNVDIIHKSYGKEKLINQVNKLIYDPQAAALEQFTNRKIAGLKMSDRVWNYTNQFRSEIEQNLFSGIQEGKSAAAMARDQIQYLKEPDRLFRRVRDVKGKLQLSKLAKEYKPGQGVYRSSNKNAMRLTRDTVNSSYRESDMVRYKTIPFILSYNVNLSNNHPKVDICDSLAGVYPPTFQWRMWHNQCLCNCTSNLASPAEFARYQQSIIDGTSENFKFKDVVTSVPENFTNYVKTNEGKMDNWKRKPDWVTENDIKI